jgi:hypothetical protein
VKHRLNSKHLQPTPLFTFYQSTPFPSIIILIPLLISPPIIRIIHPVPKLLDVTHSPIPPILNPLRNVLDLLYLLSTPPRRVLREVLDIIDRIVEAVFDAVVEALYPTDLLARPARSVLGEVGDLVAEFVEAALGAEFVAFEVVLCGLESVTSSIG